MKTSVKCLIAFVVMVMFYAGVVPGQSLDEYIKKKRDRQKLPIIPPNCERSELSSLFTWHVIYRKKRTDKSMPLSGQKSSQKFSNSNFNNGVTKLGHVIVKSHP